MAMTSPPDPGPGAMPTDEDVRLACGRTVDRVWSRIDAEPDDHERGCEHCRQARERLRRLAEVAQAARAGDDDPAAEQPGPQLRRQIMDLARTEVRRGRLLPLERPRPEGWAAELMVSEIAVMAVVREAADAVPGVRLQRCVVRLDEQPIPSGDGSDRTPPARVRLAVQVTVPVGASIPTLGDRLRGTVGPAVADRIGLQVAAVDVEVSDLHEQ